MCLKTEKLFVIKLSVGDKQYNIPYESIDECLNDIALKIILEEPNSSCSIFYFNGNRLTRDVYSWDGLKRQLVSNSTIILRQKL